MTPVTRRITLASFWTAFIRRFVSLGDYMKFATFLAGEAALKVLNVAKAPKVRLAVLLIAIIAPGVAFATNDLDGGG